jgi:hypothetical protein
MTKAGMEGLLGGCLIVAAVTPEVSECTFSCCKQILWTEVRAVYTSWFASDFLPKLASSFNFHCG